ncbi:MAG: hypothetical protein ACRDBG_27440 [Waterburya sp.]
MANASTISKAISGTPAGFNHIGKHLGVHTDAAVGAVMVVGNVGGTVVPAQLPNCPIIILLQD